MERAETINYWQNRGKDYLGEFDNQKKVTEIRYKRQEQQLIFCLKPYLGNKNINMLEIGCGFGRITKLLLNNFSFSNYDAFDLSIEQINNAKTYVNDSRVNFLNKDVFSFTPETKYDVVSAFEVFMHIPFIDIEKVIHKYSKITNQFINLDWSVKTEPKISGECYCFQHDYEKIYHEAGFDKVIVFKLKDSLLSVLFKDLKIRQKLFIASKVN